MVIGKVDHRAVLFRQGIDEAAQGGGLVLFHGDDFGRVGAVGNLRRVVVVDPVFLLLAQRRQRLEAGDAEQPRGNFGAALEARRLLPQLEKNLVRDIVGHHFRSRLARHEAVDPRVVTHEQEPNGGPVALRDPVYKRAIGFSRRVHGRSSRLAPRSSVADRSKKVHPPPRIFRRLTEERGGCQ
ncbi:hypothetical protein MPL1032_40004 [Mesorhizobium plurifarium]|uniref:Uncharacterized protein n=1 Tax=Mesorhizobium plurifarium TaxID=69974 RepID=A0A0K2W5A5_MESPL|nr:hypothetical protein MPL1032_40004 [Mesorhizobium plurifarium]